MSTRIFLTENFSEGVTKYFAINSDKIETLNVSDCYNDGQNISSSDAGDYLELLSESAVSIANGESEEDENNNGYEIGSIISAFNDHATFNLLLETKTLRDGEDYELTCETCEGFTYWDGHNWNTITTQVENGEPSHVVVDDIDLRIALDEAIEDMEFEKEGFGIRVYKSENYAIVVSSFQGTWEDYEIMSVEDYEMQANY